MWVIPSEVTTALRTLSNAFGDSRGAAEVGRGPDVPPTPRPVPGPAGVRSAADGAPAGREPDDGAEPGASGPPKAA